MRSAGFTLLELLIAMTLLAMISSLALGGLRAGTRVWDRTEATAGAQAQDLALAGFLDRLMSGVAAARIRDGTREPPILFRGGAHQMLFVAPLPTALATPREHLVELALVDGPQGQDLRLRWRPLGTGRADLNMRPGDPSATLARALSGARFAYGDGAGRRSDWAMAPALPDYIAIERAGAPLVFRLPPIEAPS